MGDDIGSGSVTDCLLRLFSDLKGRIYNPITAMGVSTMFIFQLDNTER